MKISELREKTKDELQKMLLQKRIAAGELRFMLHQKKVKNVKELAGVKKDIARILTLLTKVE